MVRKGKVTSEVTCGLCILQGRGTWRYTPREESSTGHGHCWNAACPRSPHQKAWKYGPTQHSQPAGSSNLMPPPAPPAWWYAQNEMSGKSTWQEQDESQKWQKQKWQGDDDKWHKDEWQKWQKHDDKRHHELGLAATLPAPPPVPPAPPPAPASAVPAHLVEVKSSSEEPAVPAHLVEVKSEVKSEEHIEVIVVKSEPSDDSDDEPQPRRKRKRHKHGRSRRRRSTSSPVRSRRRRSSRSVHRRRRSVTRSYRRRRSFSSSWSVHRHRRFASPVHGARDATPSVATTSPADGTPVLPTQEDLIAKKNETREEAQPGEIATDEIKQENQHGDMKMEQS